MGSPSSERAWIRDRVPGDCQVYELPNIQNTGNENGLRVNRINL